MGIAIVVPIEKVMETIGQPNLIKWEAALERKKKEQLGSIPPIP